MANDNNPQVPEGVARFKTIEGGKNNGPNPEGEVPDAGNFEVVLRSANAGEPGVTLNYQGYLVATSVFVGFADVDGIIKGCIPMDNILYVRPVEVAAA